MRLAFIANTITILIVTATLLSCNASEMTSPIGSNFPLREIRQLRMNEAIENITASDTWIGVQTRTKLIGLDIYTLKPLWSINFTPSYVDSEFRIVNDTLVAASNHEIILVNRAGQKRRLPLSSEESDITRLAAVYQDYIYVIRGSNTVLEAYDTVNNTRLWKAAVGRVGTDLQYDSSKNIAYVTSYDSGIRAFDNLTGALLWKLDKPALESTLDGAALYTATSTNDENRFRVSALNGSNGHELWTVDLVDVNGLLKMTVVGRILLASATGGLIAMDKSSGALLWRTDLGETFYASPTEFNDVLYIKGESLKLYAISPTDGTVIGFEQLETPNGILEPSYELRGRVYSLKDGIVFNTTNEVVVFGVE